MKKIIIFTLAIYFNIDAFAQANILAARNLGVGSTVTITGIVANGDELGPIRYIEDSTGGMALYDPTILASLVRGDEVTVTGELVDYNGLMEMQPVNSSTLNSSANIVNPFLVTPLQIGETTESELIQIDNVIFNNGGSMFTSGTHDFDSNGETGKIYIKAGHSLENSMIPMGVVTLIGISSQYTFNTPANDGYQILPRDSSDIIQTGALIITSSVTQSNITANSFDLSWTVSDSSSTNCNYGLTNILGTVLNNSGNTLNHTLSLTGLSPATFYYVECYSINGTDTAYASTSLYSTASNSSGEIRPYFNHSVDNSYSTGVDAQNITTYFNDTIAAYMGLAQNTLDICVYNASDATIATAINDAYDRGVAVRYIADDDVVNSMLSSLNPNIPILYRDPLPAGIMHNKFLIIDVNSTDNSWIMSGSTNWTNPSNLFSDYNNLIFVQDEAVAKAYTLEFEEMWGGTFGANKIDNTPHKFIVGESEVEVYFSPSDQTTSKINSVIESVDYTFELGLLSFTRDDLAQSIIEKNSEFGVSIRGIIEDENSTGSEFTNLQTNGVNMRSHMGISNSFHHKYAIADASNSGADPIVITGSHNWSSNAENNSDENTLIIHNATIANIYLQEFEKRWGELGNTNEINNLIDVKLDVFPNPTNGCITVSSSIEILQLNLYSVNGKLIKIEQSNKMNIENSGNYFLKILTKKGNTIKPIIVQ